MTNPQEPKFRKTRGLEVMLTGALLFLGSYALTQALPSGAPRLVSFGSANLVGQSAYVATNLTANVNQNGATCLRSRGGGAWDGLSGLSNAEARRQLTAAGIPVNSTTRTDLSGIGQEVIDELIRLKRACGNCPMVFTGGTEGDSHAAACRTGGCCHSSGCKFDVVGGDAALDNYIRNSCTPAGVRGGAHGGDRYRCGSVEYVRESNHWDASVRPSSG